MQISIDKGTMEDSADIEEAKKPKAKTKKDKEDAKEGGQAIA